MTTTIEQLVQLGIAAGGASTNAKNAQRQLDLARTARAEAGAAFAAEQRLDIQLPHYFRHADGTIYLVMFGADEGGTSMWHARPIEVK